MTNKICSIAKLSRMGTGFNQELFNKNNEYQSHKSLLRTLNKVSHQLIIRNLNNCLMTKSLNWAADPYLFSEALT